MSSRRVRSVLLHFAAVLSVVPGTSARAQSLPRDAAALVIAHGGSPAWNAPVLDAVERVSRTLPAAVGFLMGSGPTPQQAYDTLVRQGVSRIVVVPLLVSSHSGHAEQIRFLAGERADNPLAGQMDLVPLKGAATIVTATPAMDDDPMIAAVLADRARALSRNARTESLVIVAHGPNDDDEAQIWIETMERLAKQISAVVRFSQIDVRLLRDDAPKPVKDLALKQLRDTVASRAPGGRVIVVPLLLSPGEVADEIPATLSGLEFAWDGRTLLPDDRIAGWILARARTALRPRLSPVRDPRAQIRRREQREREQ